MEAVRSGRQGLSAIEIVWEDAQASAVVDWEDEAGTELMPTTTVGYLVHEDRRTVTIASLINTNSVGHVLTIPKACVVSRRTLTGT